MTDFCARVDFDYMIAHQFKPLIRPTKIKSPELERRKENSVATSLGLCMAEAADEIPTIAGELRRYASYKPNYRRLGLVGQTDYCSGKNFMKDLQG